MRSAIIILAATYAVAAPALAKARAAAQDPHRALHRRGLPKCPPAEDFIGRIAESDLAEQVVILAWHVEYQDYLGWKDQFGVKAHKDRQKTRSATAKLRTSRRR